MEDKVGVVLDLLVGKTTMAVVARSCGVDEHEVATWVDRFVQAGSAGLGGSAAADVDWSRRRQDTDRAHQLAGLGAWEWIPGIGELRWSDQLYRLFGLDPRAAPVGLESFLTGVHPDDRQHVEVAVAQLRRELRPMTLDHRVVGPEEEIRWLRHRGTTVTGEDGRIRALTGTVQDVTEGKTAETVLRDTGQFFRTLVDAVPDAVIGVDANHRISLVNQQAVELFGYQPSALVGQPIQVLIPGRYREAHARQTAAYVTNPQTRPMGVGLDLVAVRADGSEFPADISLSPFPPAVRPDGGVFALAAVRDVTERRAAEQAARALVEADQRRRQARQINDDLIQGLAAAVYALEDRDLMRVVALLDQTLTSARAMLDSLLDLDGDIQPGDLVRDVAAAPMSTTPDAADERSSAPQRPITVLVADDNADIRLALRTVLESFTGIRVVAEAADGRQAVELAARLLPNVVLLDLAMPALDGLQALPRIRSLAPESKVVVLSGYGKEQAAEQALQAGAVAYVEKGRSARRIAAVLAGLFPEKIVTEAASAADRPVWDLAPGGSGPGDDALAMYAHELRSPVAALEGLAHALLNGIDKMPSPAVRQILEAVARNIRQLDHLVQDLADAARIGTADLALVTEPVDVGRLLYNVLAENAEIATTHPVTLSATAGIVATLDPVRIRQAVTNLLTNAAKFSPEGATIDVVMDADAPTVRITVTDHGPGVPEQHREHVFGKFQRLPGSSGGTGLGLYISRGIARAHGGDLELADSSPSGSTFVLWLPCMSPDDNGDQS